MCEGEDEPLCVKWCLVDALTLEEREEEVDALDERDNEIEFEAGLESLVNRFGIDKVADLVTQLSKKK
jgi:benzoyl-CoA reductase subunit BamC